jgi:multiple antibiotic resistance protein
VGFNQIARQVLLIVGALFPIVNPLGTAPIFLTLTEGLPAASRGTLARKVAINGFLLLLGAIFVGNYILSFFGISLPVVQVGGGLIVFTTGWKLLQSSGEDSVSRRLSAAEAEKRAFYPLTLPLTVGPGTISVAITVGANVAEGSATNLTALVVGSAIVAVTIYLSYRFAQSIAHALGEAAMNVILRLSSFILVCIGVQIVWNGLRALAAGLR